MTIPGVSPFFLGGPIPSALASKHFYGFEEERRTLVQLVNRRTSVSPGVLGQAKSGKTSLVLAVAAALPAPRVHLDCRRIWPSTPGGFYRLLLESLGASSARIPGGTPAEAVRAILHGLPRKPEPALLVLDNADALYEIDEALPGAILSPDVRWPFRILVTARPGPIQRHIEIPVTLPPFSASTTSEFLRDRFRASSLTLDEDAIPVFYEFSRGAPESLQRLSHATWQMAKLRGWSHIAAANVDEVVSELVDSLPTEHLTSWAAVRGIMRDVFIAMCLYDLEAPTEIARRLGLEPKNVVVLLGRLCVPHGLAERTARGTYRVRDPLLKHYVRREWGSPILR